MSALSPAVVAERSLFADEYVELALLAFFWVYGARPAQVEGAWPLRVAPR